MDTKQILTFITLAETSNYIKAADRLNYAPSTLAKHIRSLEEELGTKLVEHRENRIRLTREGERFYAYAQKMMETYWEAMEKVADPACLTGGVRIAGGEPIVGFSLSPFLLDFSNQYPKVSVNVQMICCARVPAWLRGREVDMGYIYEMEQLEDDVFERVSLYNEPVWLVTTPGNPLAEREQVCYQDLQDQKFAFTYDDCCFTMAFRDRMRQRGIAPASELFLGSVSAVINSVTQSDRIALIPHSILPHIPGASGLVRLNWVDEPLRSWVQIVYDKNRHLSHVEKEMIRQARQYAAALVEQDGEGQLHA